MLDSDFDSVCPWMSFCLCECSCLSLSDFVCVNLPLPLINIWKMVHKKCVHLIKKIGWLLVKDCWQSIVYFQEAVVFSSFCVYLFGCLVSKLNNKLIFLFLGFTNLWRHLLKWVIALTLLSNFCYWISSNPRCRFAIKCTTKKKMSGPAM